MKITTSNVVGYSYSEGTGKFIQGVNPVLNELIEDKFFIASDEDVNTALDKAEEAFYIYKNTSTKQREKFLNEIADQIEALGDVLIKRASLETGLPEARIIGERGRTTGQLRAFAKYIVENSYVDATIDMANPARTPVPKPDLRKMMMPLGPVVVFGASNFPLAYSVAGGDTAAAFAAGCPVVVKAHPAHPGTSALVAQAIVKAAKACNLPDGVFSLLYDNGFRVGQLLVEHRATQAVGFTGSTAGGRALFDIAAKRQQPIPVFAEMGSTNPTILLPKALANRSEAIANSYLNSITVGVGQFCTNPGIIIGEAGKNLSHFIATLAKGITLANPGTMLHSGISNAYKTKANRMESQKGVELISLGKDTADTGQARPILAKAPGNEFIKNPSLHEEVFGPFSIIIECKNRDELNQCISRLHGQLTVTIIGEDDELEENSLLLSVVQEKAGRVIFNGVPTGVEVCAAMTHGGPYPATTDSRFTAVGIHSIRRFLRPVSFQNAPQNVLPKALQDPNPLKIWRLIDGELSKEPIKK